MNISFLPEKVKGEFAGIMDKSPLSAARASGNIDGEPGESYVISCGDRLYVYSRKAGEDSFLKLSGKPDAGISKLEIRKDKFNIYLDLEIDGNARSLKFSSSEHHDLVAVVDSIKSPPPVEVKAAAIQTISEPAGVEIPVSPQIPEPQGLGMAALPLSPMQYMAAAMMYVASSDGTIAKDEDRHIINVFCGNNDILQPALRYFKSHSVDQLFASAGSLSEEQKICVLANLVELGMRDESYHRVEQVVIRNFMEKAGISRDNLKAITNVLLVKNNLSVLGT